MIDWYRETVASTSNGVVVADHEGLIRLVNPEALRILQNGHQDWLGRPVEDLLPVTGPLMRQCLRTGEPVLGYQALGRDLADSIVSNITPVLREGQMRGVVCNFQALDRFDATARQLASFQQMHRQLQAVVDSSSDGIFVCDRDGLILNMNQASESISGIRRTDCIGRSIRTLLEEGLIDQSVTLEVLKAKRMVNRMVRVGRTDKTILVTGTPVFAPDGRIEMVVLNERDITQLNRIREELAQTQREKERINQELAVLNLLDLRDGELKAQSETMRQVVSTALKLAHLDVANILITGESGTGKGLLCRFIHNHGPRAGGPFMHINCAALPDTLLEAELFGYDRGAFTGAGAQGKPGLLELAQKGTLFLDEIGDMPLSTQVKLLKYLDDGRVMHLGGTREIPIDCLVVAATNRDLLARVRERKFRRDLYYRLNAFSLHIPALRDRTEDIQCLALHFLELFNHEYGRQCRLGASGLELLTRLPLVGNARELKNLLNKAVALAEGEELDGYLERTLGAARARGAGEGGGPEAGDLPSRLAALEREILREALERHGTTRAVAQALGISQPTVVRKLARHGLGGGQER